MNYYLAIGREREVAEYTALSYSHILLGAGEVSGKEFADRIRNNYLMTERRHQVCAELAEKLIYTIKKMPTGIKVTYK